MYIYVHGLAFFLWKKVDNLSQFCLFPGEQQRLRTAVFTIFLKQIKSLVVLSGFLWCLPCLCYRGSVAAGLMSNCQPPTHSTDLIHQNLVFQHLWIGSLKQAAPLFHMMKELFCQQSRLSWLGGLMGQGMLISKF